MPLSPCRTYAKDLDDGNAARYIAPMLGRRGVKSILALSLLFFSISGFASGENLSHCEAPLREAQQKLEALHATTRKNANPETVKPNADEPVAFGLAREDAEASSSKEALARLKGLQNWVESHKQGQAAGKVKVLFVQGDREIGEALKEISSEFSHVEHNYDGADINEDSEPDNGPSFSIGGFEIPARIGWLRIPRAFIASMFGVWVFPGPVFYDATGASTRIHEFLSNPTIGQWIARSLGHNPDLWFHQWILPHSTQVTMTVGILVAAAIQKVGFRLPRPVAWARSQASAFLSEESEDDEEVERELTPVAAQFRLFQDTLRQSRGNAFRFFGTNYFDRDSVSNEDADGESPNRSFDMLYYLDSSGKPTLVVVDHPLR